MSYTPKHIQRWYETVNYEGQNFDQYYVAYWRLFKSTPMERSNFLYVMQHLKDSGCDPEHIKLPVFTDECFLYRYYILVHEDADRALRMADMLAERIKRKGSLDTETESKYNAETIQSRWGSYKLPKRVELCQEAGVSVFSARHKYFPYDSDGAEELRDLLSEMS